MHPSDSWIQGNLPTCSSVCPGFSQQCCVCCRSGRGMGSMHHPSEARIPQLQTHLGSLSRFIPSPTSLWGKFLQDASCFSLNPLSSLNSIKLGTVKAYNDLLIEDFFHGTTQYLQQAFSSFVSTWIFWLRFLSMVVRGAGSCHLMYHHRSTDSVPGRF